MKTYKDLYLYLFGQIAAAVEELEDGKTVLAANRLIEAQKNAEEMVLNETRPDSPAGA